MAPALMYRRGLIGQAVAAALLPIPAVAQACGGTIHLTIDTGWSREAEDIAATLRRHAVRATLFVADEPTFRGDRTLDDSWAPFWRARVAEGHNFASHTWRHWYFAGDRGPSRVRYASRRRGEGGETLDQAGLCAELTRSTQRLTQLAPGAQVLPLWRAPGGITTSNALAMAAACGLRHQGWSANGFWGDELDSTSHPNASLARRAIANTRPGEVVVLHWGVRSRQVPFAQVLDEVIAGLKARGLCFAPLTAAGVV